MKSNDILNAPDMKSVRHYVDSIDTQIIELLTLRKDCMVRAAQIKPTFESVRDEKRKKFILDKITAEANEKNLDPQLLQSFWNDLIEWSITFEEKQWKKIKKL